MGTQNTPTPTKSATTAAKTEAGEDFRILVVPMKRGLAAANQVFDFVRGELDNADIETRMVLQEPAIVRRERASEALLAALKDSLPLLASLTATEPALDAVVASHRAAIAKVEG